MNYSYSGMCQDGHQRIGDNDTREDDRCPYCRAIDLLLWIRDRQHIGDEIAEAIDTWIVQDEITRGADSSDAAP